MKKYLLAALLIGCAAAAAGCGNSQKKETEAPKPVETAATRDVSETQAAAAETEEAAVEPQAPVTATEAEAAATEAEAAVTVAPAAETEAETVETEDVKAETEEETEDYGFGETEPDDYFNAYETESETEPVPMPEYDVSDYLVIEDDGYKTITVEVAPARKATEEEVDEEIRTSFRYLEDYDDLVLKKTEGKVVEGDILNIDYVGSKDGVEFDGGTDEGYDLEIGSGTFIPGFEDGLIGKEIGSEVDLNLTFPEDYGVEDLNGEDVVFHVTLNYVAEIPELTDEIAKKLSGEEFDNVEDYVESVRSDIQAHYDEEYRNSVYTQIMTKLTELYPVEKYPEENVEYLADNLMKQYIAPYAAMYGMSVGDFIAMAYGGLTEEEFREEQLLPAAQSNLDQEMILTAIGKREGLSMTDAEFEKMLRGYAEEYGISVDDLIGNTDIGLIRSSMIQERIMEWLYENVNIKEIEETEAEDAFASETEDSAFGASAETEAETAAETEVG